MTSFGLLRTSLASSVLLFPLCPSTISSSHPVSAFLRPPPESSSGLICPSLAYSVFRRPPTRTSFFVLFRLPPPFFSFLRLSLSFYRLHRPSEASTVSVRPLSISSFFLCPPLSPASTACSGVLRSHLSFSSLMPLSKASSTVLRPLLFRPSLAFSNLLRAFLAA